MCKTSSKMMENNQFKIGDKVKVKCCLAKTAGILPDGIKNKKDAKFMIVKLDQAQQASAFVQMPNNVGKQHLINNDHIWGWWIYLEDLELV